MKSPATAMRRPRRADTIRVSFRVSIVIGKRRRPGIRYTSLQDFFANDGQARSYSSRGDLRGATVAALWYRVGRLVRQVLLPPWCVIATSNGDRRDCLSY